MHEKLKERLQRAIVEKVFPGCVLGIVHKNGTRDFLAFGNYTYEADSRLMTEHAIFDVASITKSIPTSSILLQLIDQKELKLEDKIADFIPDFGNMNDKKQATVQHVLTYTINLDLPASSSLKDKSPNEIVDTIIKASLKSPLGTEHIYANTTAVFVSLIIEKVTGEKIEAYADEHFFKPFNMHATSFYPKLLNQELIVPTEVDTWRGRTIVGEVHDEVSYTLQKKYMFGIAGLFTTAPDLLNFLEMLLNKGTLHNKKYFSPEIVQAMHTNYAQAATQAAGLGWSIQDPAVIGTQCSEDTFFKTGFTGCIVVVDPIREIAFTLLSNRTYPKRPRTLDSINEVRRDIADILII